MVGIDGNTIATIQKLFTTKNEYGEKEQSYVDYIKVKGFLDLQSGNALYSYNAKIVESTHIFICDYQKIEITEENSRMVIDGKAYEITYIDNPMNLNYHLECYLKYIGGAQNV